MNLGARIGMWSGGKELPYEQLTYIESDGNATCKLGLSYKSSYTLSGRLGWFKDSGVSFAATIVDGRYYGGSNICVAGCYLAGATVSAVRLSCSNGKSKDTSYRTRNDYDECDFVFSPNGSSVDGDPLDISFEMNDAYPFDLTLFNEYKGFRRRIANLQVSEGGVYVADLIPVIRKDDNRVCFYDKARDIYFPSTTGIEFTAIKQEVF